MVGATPTMSEIFSCVGVKKDASHPKRVKDGLLELTNKKPITASAVTGYLTL
jgi:hypothetical protein